MPVPDLIGTWKGEILSNYPNGDGTARDPIETYVVVRQTFSWITVRQYTAESESTLLSGNISADIDGVQRITGVYHNVPRYGVREKSPIHYGAFSYVLGGRPVSSISGAYWTDRKTAGEATFLMHSSKLFISFEAARSGSYHQRV
jgi:hypothetical protein